MLVQVLVDGAAELAGDGRARPIADARQPAREHLRHFPAVHGGGHLLSRLVTTQTKPDQIEASGYYRPGLQRDRDEYDRAARYFLALLGDGGGGAWLLGSARVILGEARPGFRFPAECAFEFELPAAIRDTAASQRVEVTRVVAEAVQGIVIGGLLTPLGLIQAIASYTLPLGIQAGLAVIKLRFLRALQRLGMRLHEIEPARLIYPEDGPTAGYYHHHPDPVVPVYWLNDEIAPSVDQAIARYQGSAG